VAGLNPNLRLVDNRPTDAKAVQPVAITQGDDEAVEPRPKEPEDTPVLDAEGNVIKIEHADGSVTVSINGKPLQSAERAERTGWFKNLADDISDMELTRICEDLMRGIADDDQSRQEWVDMVADSVSLLGLKLENPQSGTSGDGAAVEGMSRVRHPLLLEACLRFQANANGEFLPVDGPVKVRDDDNNSTPDFDDLANQYQKDFNHYLTSTAHEFYPDTDRMFLKLGFQGMGFKKIYYCPIRQRPVSETVEAKDLIVNNEATSLQNASRITHRIWLKKSTFKRMQILGVYRDVDVGTARQPDLNAIDKAEKEQQGVAQGNMSRPEDRDREIYECYCELDIEGYEHKWRGKPSGLEVPYRVTIDVSSRQILAVCRDYNKKSVGPLPERRRTFVPYVFVPGFGFYGIGLLHILGNTTNAITAAWREMLDNGMFANFPGFLYAKQAGRQDTLLKRVPPGGGSPIDTQGMPIGQAVMPLPYNTTQMAPLMTLVDNMAQTGMRLGGTSEQPVEEPRGNTPVGTTLATIEQAQKIINSVHKRMHAAQALEFACIAECFKEHPESFWECRDAPSYPWDQETFERALGQCNLVPVADPNTASQTQRIAKVVALKGAQSAAPPGMYDPIAVERIVVRTIGFNPDQLLAPPEALGKPTPDMENAKAELDIKRQNVGVKQQEVQVKEREAQGKQALGQAELQLKQQGQTTEQGLGAIKARVDMETKQKDLDSKEQDRLMGARLQLIDLAQNVAVHPESAGLVEPIAREAFQDIKERQQHQDVKQHGKTFGDLGGDMKGQP
jgi:hypothetical protein